MKTAIFPGSFDLFHQGHYDLVLRALVLFDKLFIVVADNPYKKQASLAQRYSQVCAFFAQNVTAGIEIVPWPYNIVSFARKYGVKFIIRGIRNVHDFWWEKKIAKCYQKAGDIELVYFLAKDAYVSFSASKLLQKEKKHMKNRKVVLIGCGAVGTSFVYAALNQGLFNEIVLVDNNADAAFGNVMDFEDGNVMMPQPACNIKTGTYADCSDADLVVITAGVAQKPGGETRIELLGRNAKIIKEIAIGVQQSGFSGITIIVSNPVDVLGTIYQKITGFDPQKVIPSGTLLDSMRLRYEIAKRLELSPQAVSAFVIGEHGDSSVSVFSQVSIGPLPLEKYKKFSDTQKKQIHKSVMTKAYKIINAKRATFYGIGAGITRLCRAILFDENVILPVAIKKDDCQTYIGWPTVINQTGAFLPLKLNLTPEEKKAFNKSAAILSEVYNSVMAELEHDN